MSFTVAGIPMVLIPHPQGPWSEGINPITNSQWVKGVASFMNEGAKFGLLEPHYREDLMLRHFGNFDDLLDTVGHDNIPEEWRGNTMRLEEQGIFIFQWQRNPSKLKWSYEMGFDGDCQPAVGVSWAEAKAWTLAQGGLYLLTDKQWEWSARGGERKLKYSTETGELLDPDDNALAHCSVTRREKRTIDVNDPKYSDGPFGLRHKTGNVCEWVERNRGDKGWEYGLRGGSWENDSFLEATFRNDEDDPCIRDFNFGFRVGAPALQESR